MNSVKRMFMDYVLWPLWKHTEKTLMSVKEGEDAIVVLGVPRSGTSTLAGLVKECGVYFGEPAWMRPADDRNPDGFLELREMNILDNRLIYESGYASRLMGEPGLSLRAQPMRRLSRMFTLRRMVRLLGKLASGKGELHRWGFKEFSDTYYWWRRYVPKARIIGVYRDPHACADSIYRTFKRFTFEQSLDWWMRGNRELLYHLSQADSLLIKLEDLTHPEKREMTLAAIAQFCGGDVKQLIQENKGERGYQKKLPDTLPPLSAEAKELLASLEQKAHQSLLKYTQG